MSIQESRDLLPSPDHEEGAGAYRLGGFHHVYKGNLCHGRYEVLSKMEYGVD